MNKVYVIDQPGSGRSTMRRLLDRTDPHRSKSPERPRDTFADRPVADDGAVKFGSAGWGSMLVSYAAGPFLAITRSRGGAKIRWAVFSALCVMYVVLALTTSAMFLNSLDGSRVALPLWLIFGPGVTMAIFTGWSRSIAASPRPPAKLPRVLRNARVVTMVGVMAPGFGLLLAGRRRLAAMAFTVAGFAAVCAMTILNWSWIHTQAGFFFEGGMPERALISAIAVLFVCMILWALQAVIGGRHFRTDSIHLFSELATVVLVALAIAFMAWFRPSDVARSLNSAATTLETQGLRVVPLAVYETAMRFDPANGTYVANAARLNSALGMAEAHDAKIGILENRIDQYRENLAALTGNDAAVALAGSVRGGTTATAQAQDTGDHVVAGRTRSYPQRMR